MSFVLIIWRRTSLGITLGSPFFNMGHPTWPERGRPQSHRVKASLDAFISSMAVKRPRVVAILSNRSTTPWTKIAVRRLSALDHEMNHNELNLIAPISRKRFRCLNSLFVNFMVYSNIKVLLVGLLEVRAETLWSITNSRRNLHWRSVALWLSRIR